MIYPDLLPPRDYPHGSLIKVTQQVPALQGNVLGQPTELVHDVYLPPGYAADSGPGYPLFVCLAAYTNAGPGQVAWRNHGETVPERLDRLLASAAMGPVIAVFPNAWNALGGNQYVNSTTIGPWVDIICDQLLAQLDQQLHTLGGSGRAVFGKSSGGFGALHLAMSRPGTFSAVAAHAADMGFDAVYLPDMPTSCQVLERYDYDLPRFVRQFWRRKKADYREFHALMTLCLAASYDPQPQQPLGLRLPFSQHYCELLQPAWQNWLGFDPVRWSQRQLHTLAGLHGLWLDVGRFDQYHIQFGSRRFHQRLEEAGIEHYYEEFDGNHSGMDWRLDESLPYLYHRSSQTGSTEQ
ncbi:MAG: alpha/beta hydrolase-fold protein [Gammaproteobacteria bacterium]|jgi:enterochelin esterase-like enzyme|nr:alpha/beta hydrolase-fold protein [Gammaproteobacteria bacterium]